MAAYPFLYWSDYTNVSIGARTIRKATAQIAGADGPQIPITDTRCLVGSTAQFTVQTGVRFLIDRRTDLDVLVPDAVVTFVNTQLGKSFAFQTFTWRQLFKQLFLALSRLNFSADDGFDI